MRVGSVADPEVAAEIGLTGDKRVALPDLRYSDLSEDELSSLGRLVEVSAGSDDQVLVRPLRRLVVGSLAFKGRTISVPPPIATESFLTLLVTAIAPELLTKKFAGKAEVAAGFRADKWSRYFEILVAVLCLTWIEQILTSHIAQTYVRHEDRLTTLRGRVQWSANFGRHPVEGLQCQYFSLQTDNLLNRLVLASLLKCSLVLRNTPWSSKAQTQAFIWRSVASVHSPGPGDFEVAQSKITRQTEHYRAALRMGEALLFGHAPKHLVPKGNQWLQGMYFHMDRLFEDFLFELLRKGTQHTNLTVRKQFAQGEAFLNAYGRTYMQVRPDIVVFRAGKPVAVIDAKYKPAYMSGGPDVPVDLSYRVSAGDLYQMFFYEARLRHRYESPHPLKTGIVAPLLAHSEPVERPYRSIRFNAAGEIDSAVLEVMPLPLDEVLARAREGDFAGGLSAAGELKEFLQHL